MTNPQNTNPGSADSDSYLQERTRFRVEVSPHTHQTLREVALQEGKYMKVLAEEILQGYLQTYFDQRSRDSNGSEPEEDPQQQS